MSSCGWQWLGDDVTGQVVHASAFAEPAGNQHDLAEATERPTAARSAIVMAMSGEQPVKGCSWRGAGDRAWQHRQPT